MNPLPAIERRISVALAPAAAFDLFTRGMRAWWPFAGHSCGGQAGGDVHFEPRAGGAVTELAPDGTRYVWGTLSEWSPPHAFEMSWHPGLPAAAATRLRVSFTATAEGTEVHVQHGGWEARGDQAADKRDQYGNGWSHTLQAFSQAAQAAA